jgi:rSAM/selenodomain-associated transferase 1
MQASHDGVTAVVFAKLPEAGRVKTRLAGEMVDDAGAAGVALAMLRCTVRRLRRRGRVVLAIDPDGARGAFESAIDAGSLETVDQGPGTLGDRLDRVWRAVAPATPVAFFGADTPDVPMSMLAEIDVALAEADAAVGPTGDGGYWTLAAARHRPELLRDIDWGGDRVYDQTCRRAAGAGVRLHVLPAWHDVDRPQDVSALVARLQRVKDDEDLRVLAERLRVLWPGVVSEGGPST